MSGRRKPQPVQLPGLEEDQSPLASFAREIEEAGERWRLDQGRATWEGLVTSPEDRSRHRDADQG